MYFSIFWYNTLFACKDWATLNRYVTAKTNGRSIVEASREQCSMYELERRAKEARSGPAVLVEVPVAKAGRRAYA